MATFGTFTSGQVLTAAELNTAGAWSSYTPTWTQTVAVTKTVNWALYSELGKIVFVNVQMTATGSGTAAADIVVGLPVTASANNFVIGHGAFFTSTTSWPFLATLNTSTSIRFISPVSTGFPNYFSGTAGTNVNLVSGDIVNFILTYEAA